MAVNHDANGDACTFAYLAYCRSRQDVFNLTRSVTHDSDRHISLMELPQGLNTVIQRPTPGVGVTRSPKNCCCLNDIVLWHTNGFDISHVVRIPIRLARAGSRLRSHAAIVRTVIHRQVTRRSVVGQERSQNRRVRDHEDSTGVKKHRIDFMISDDESRHLIKSRRADCHEVFAQSSF